MPSLIIQTDDRLQAGVLTARVLCGRKPFNMVVIDHEAVSRIHAWMELRDGQWVVGDCGGRNGTWVNGERIDRITPLRDGDEIHIARTTITFRQGEHLPAEAEVIDLAHLDEHVTADDSGFLVWCACGAPIWTPNFLAGCVRPCGHCGKPVQLPDATPAPSAAQPAMPAALCGICQCAIGDESDPLMCDDCGMRYHRECWEENEGCGTYGCSQVNVLAPAVAAADATTSPALEPAPAGHPHPAHSPHAHLFLAASVVATVLGALTFGTPALVVMVAAILYLIRRPHQRGVIVASVLVSLLGVAAGIVLSYHWWLQ